MKIAINAWFWDNPKVGSGQYLKHLIPALLEADEGLEINLISPRPFGNIPANPRLSTHVAITPLPNQAGNLAKVWFEQMTFPQTAKRLQADVAHVPYFGSPLTPNIPTVVTIHDLIPMMLPEYRGGLRVRLYTSLVAAAAARADLVLADSKASQQDILQRLGLPEEQVQVVYLAPAPDFQPPERWEQLTAITQKYELPDDFILYLGGYDIRKNVSALLHAYTWVSASLGDQFPLVLAGALPEADTDFFPDPLRIARELKIEPQIITPGYIAAEDLPLLYAAATVFVYPSRYEGFGLPVLEAMACGTPVITTNTSSIPELAGPAAFQFAPNDTKHIAAAMIRLCTEEESVQEMAGRGLARADQFTWQKTATATLQAYQDALK